MFKVLSTSEILLFLQINLSFIIMNTGFFDLFTQNVSVDILYFLNVILLSIIYEVHINLYIGQFIQSKRICFIFKIFKCLIYLSIKICCDNFSVLHYLLIPKVKEAIDYILQ